MPTGRVGGRTGTGDVSTDNLDGINRRSFLKSGAAAIGTTALSYGRIAGANDRISLGQIGFGRRGRELGAVAAGLRHSHNVEVTAVADLWRVNREKAVAAATDAYQRAPQSFSCADKLLADKNVDAVIIATADFQHAPHLTWAVQAGKDAYVEKPMANDLEDARVARDAVRSRNVIVQMGTQHRSEPYQSAVKEIIERGALGDVSKVEIVWNYHGPRWRGRSEVEEIREDETDWKRWLIDKPYRPFDPRAYFEFRLYRDFSSGIPDQWMSHGMDMVHFLLDDHYPKSVVAMGGVFAWNDGRENPDTFQALLEYPSGFMVSYSTSFGNDSDSFTRIMGTKATLVNIGGEGSQRWKLIEEKGTHEDNPFVHRSQKLVTLAGERRPGSWSQHLLMGAVEKTYGPLPFISDSDPSHMTNWFECLRSRKQPNATVEDGFAHSVAVIMAARSQREGKKLYWDSRSEQIVENAPA